MLNTGEPIRGFGGQYHWLSNFAECEVQYDGVFYPTVENAYVAAKTLDKDARKQFEKCSPGRAKRLGRYLVLRPDWDFVKVDIMRSLLLQKFNKPSYKALLLETEGRYIEETNTWGDKFWGVDGTGKNMLGILIMQIRDILL